PTLFVLTATATPRTAPLSLHDALPISGAGRSLPRDPGRLPAILLRLDQPVTLGASTEEIGKVKANEGSEPRACKPDLTHRRGITRARAPDPSRRTSRPLVALRDLFGGGPAGGRHRS